MKKWIRKYALILLYTVVMMLMIVLENYLAHHWQKAMWINLITLGVFLAAGMLFYILIRWMPEKEDASEVKKEKPFVPTKEEYYILASSFSLTKRELELGYLVVSGYSNAQIAQQLFIAESTVKKHVTHIYEKMGVSGRREFRELFKNENNL